MTATTELTLPGTSGEDLKTRLYLDLAQRSLPGTPFYPALGLLVVLASDYGGGDLQLIGLMLVLLVVPAVLRATICRLAPRRIPKQRVEWYRMFASASLLQACSWSAFCVVGIATTPGGVSSSFLLLLCTAGIASGVPSSLGLDARLAPTFLMLLILPLVTLIAAEGEGAYGLVVVFLLFFVYLFFLGRRMGDEHTQLSSQAILLELRADQLKDEVGERERAENKALENQRRFRDLVRRAPVGILELDASGVILSANPFGRRLLDLDEGLSQNLGTSLWNLLGLSGPPEALEESELVFSMGGSDDRSWVAVSQVEAARIGESVGSVVVLVDVTEQHLAEEEIRRARDAAEDGSRMKSEFLANMSHELRTPMNGIVGFAEILTEVDDADQQAEFVGLLKESTERLLAVVERILEFAGLDRDDSCRRSEFSLDAILDEALGPLRYSAVEKGIEVVVDVDESVPSILIGDGISLSRVFRNLLENAVSFTENGEVRVSARRIDRSKGEHCIQFEVADTGIGIPESRHESVFMPFEQVDGSTTRAHGGVGLGLAISSRLVQRLGGDLDFESAVGEGTTFRWKLGFRSESEEDAPAVRFDLEESFEQAI